MSIKRLQEELGLESIEPEDVFGMRNPNIPSSLEILLLMRLCMLGFWIFHDMIHQFLIGDEVRVLRDRNYNYGINRMFDGYPINLTLECYRDPDTDDSICSVSISFKDNTFSRTDITRARSGEREVTVRVNGETVEDQNQTLAAAFGL